MKIYINEKFDDIFSPSGFRIRRNLIQIYSLLGHEVISDIEEECGLYHFISLEDKENILKLVDKEQDVIVSYFVNQSLSIEKGLENIKIPSEDKRILNKVKCIIVPSNNDKKILLFNEITTPIEVITPGVKEERFTNLTRLELESFLNYVGITKDEVFAISVVSYKNKKDIKDLIYLAKAMPKLKIFVFGPNLGFLRTPMAINRMMSRCPRNIKFKNYVPEDIYKSAVLLSKYYIVSREASCETLDVLDASITKTQIIALDSHLVGDTLIDYQNCLACFDGMSLANLIKNYEQGKIRSTVEKAYLGGRKENFIEISQKLERIIADL